MSGLFNVNLKCTASDNASGASDCHMSRYGAGPWEGGGGHTGVWIIGFSISVLDQFLRNLSAIIIVQMRGSHCSSVG